MNKLFLSVLLASTVMFSGTINAAENNIPQVPMANNIHMKHSPMKMHEAKAKKIAKELNLTQEQEAKAQKIRQEGQEKMKPLMDEMKALREKMKAQKIRKDGQEKMKPLMEEMKAIRKKMDAERTTNMKEFESILTNEQKAKFENMKKKEHQDREKRMKDMHKRMGRAMHKAPKAK